ncbi:hypothetical protein TNCV_2145921 [Trichonephila clavipes]|uniref:Uncharacterized protein n=1 Tax=Trichonephila clavipes TaxID=2585209 RepID=A0A8X6VRZ0_TRICX|nr:hypothetical protein TNCV_2145921 [Trichonephila clavipes]
MSRGSSCNMMPFGPDFILVHGNVRHVELIWSTDFWKVKIFAEWIGQLNLLSSTGYSKCRLELWRGQPILISLREPSRA